MFYIRLSDCLDKQTPIEDIQLPEVPSTGDTIEIMTGRNHKVVTYRVLARRFCVNFLDGAQISLDRPQAIIQVEEVLPTKGFEWKAIG